MHTRPGRHHQGQHELIGPGSIGNADFHGIEMASYVRGVDVCDGNIEARARAAHLLCRGHNGFRAAQDLAHCVSAGDVPQRTMLEFARFTNDGALAITFDRFRIATERGNQRLGHIETQWIQILHEACDLLHKVPGKGIVNDRECCGSPLWFVSYGTALVEDFFDGDDALANANLRHAINSWREIAEGYCLVAAVIFRDDP